MRMFGAPAVLAACVATVLLAVAPANVDAQQKEVPRVANGSDPAKGERQIELKEMWRAGGEDDETFFGMIGDIFTGPDGNLYLLDSQLSQAYVYSPDGEHLRSIGREGDGPGEVRRPADAFLTTDGKIAMIQTFPGRVVLLTPTGEPAGSMDIAAGDPSQGRFAVFVQGDTGGETMALAGIRMSMSGPGISDQKYFLSRIDASGKELVTYFTKDYQINYSDFVLSEQGMDFVWNGRYDIGPDGRVYAAPDRDAYAIHVLEPDGTPVRVIEKAHTSWKRTGDEKEEARLTLEAIAKNYPAPPRSLEVTDTEPAIADIRAFADGTLWVRSSRSDRERTDGTLVAYDVFDENGRYRERVVLEAPGDPRNDMVILLSPDRLVVVTRALEAFRSMQGVTSAEGEGDADEVPMEVICYALGK